MRAIRLIGIFALLALTLVLVPSERARGELVALTAPKGEIIEIPLADRELQEPYEQYYTSDLSYEDPSISVNCEYGRFRETDYVVAYVKIANASQFRSAMESDDGWDTMYAERLGRHCGCVVGINGDYFRYHAPAETRYIVRQGRTYTVKARGQFDALIEDENGDMHIIPKSTRSAIEAVTYEKVNVWSFGPGLVIDGEPNYGVVDYYIGSITPAQRVAIAQTGPLEYFLVATAGPDNPGSVGLNLDEFIELIESLGDVQNAYNFDGGTSASLIFRGRKLNTFGGETSRAITDMVIFATAWRGE